MVKYSRVLCSILLIFHISTLYYTVLYYYAMLYYTILRKIEWTMVKYGITKYSEDQALDMSLFVEGPNVRALQCSVIV